MEKENKKTEKTIDEMVQKASADVASDDSVRALIIQGATQWNNQALPCALSLVALRCSDSPEGMVRLERIVSKMHDASVSLAKFLLEEAEELAKFHCSPEDIAKLKNDEEGDNEKA